MTRNQIAYFEANERKRNNLRLEELRASEIQEATRHNQAQEAETYRFNVASNQLGFAQLTETGRHNRAAETVEQAKAQETGRHNLVVESQSAFQNRLGAAQLTESIRAHKQDEAIRREQIAAGILTSNISASAQRYSADQNYAASVYATDTNANTQRWNMFVTSVQKKNEFAETRRHNKVNEGIAQTNSIGGLLTSFGIGVSGVQRIGNVTPAYGPNVIKFPTGGR